MSTKTDLAMDLIRSMTELRNQIRRFVQLKIKVAEIDITFEMLEVMFQLWQKDAINQQELSNLTFRDKSSMTYLLDNLVKRNLVERVANEADRRNKLILLTDKGRELQMDLKPLLIELYSVAAGNLSGPTLQNGTKLLNDMIGNINKQANNTSSDE
jgi:DNA-binding MarR family transcriptional regulator